MNRIIIIALILIITYMKYRETFQEYNIESLAKIGDVGAKGPKGDRGSVGPQGPIGRDGNNGSNGQNGRTGKNGRNGSNSNLPNGSIIAFYKSTGLPNGWYLCDGRTHNRYKTPDLRGRFILGTNPSHWTKSWIGKSLGRDKVTLTVNELPSHSHRIDSSNATHKHSGTSNDAGTHDHMIKTKQDDFNVSGGPPSGGPSWGRDNGALGDHKKTDSSGSHKHTFSTNNANATHTHKIHNSGAGKPFYIWPPFVGLVYIMKCR